MNGAAHSHRAGRVRRRDRRRSPRGVAATRFAYGPAPERQTTTRRAPRILSSHPGSRFPAGAAVRAAADAPSRGRQRLPACEPIRGDRPSCDPVRGARLDALAVHAPVLRRTADRAVVAIDQVALEAHPDTRRLKQLSEDRGRQLGHGPTEAPRALGGRAP